MLLWIGLAVVGLIIYLKYTQKKQIVRFSRKTCKFCVESQPEWDAFKGMALADKVNFDIIDVDIENNSIHTRNWLAKYKVDGVPKVIKITGFGTTEYNGPRTSAAYMQFALA